VTTALDSARGYAAFSLLPAEAAVLTVEFKTNLLAPASGERFRFLGRVIKPGRTITVCDQALAVGANAWRSRAHYLRDDP
jgi:acyl-coenzyme A thioesterase PaaI-like protein